MTWRCNLRSSTCTRTRRRRTVRFTEIRRDVVESGLTKATTTTMMMMCQITATRTVATMLRIIRIARVPTTPTLMCANWRSALNIFHSIARRHLPLVVEHLCLTLLESACRSALISLERTFRPQAPMRVSTLARTDRSTRPIRRFDPHLPISCLSWQTFSPPVRPVQFLCCVCVCVSMKP